ncbi:MAG: alanyl-tRNA editing protein [Ilumatobacteraceae bacterium]
MAVYLCHEQPDLLEHEAVVVESRPGAVLLNHSALHPGGGGQLGDTARLGTLSGQRRITGIEIDSEGRWWHLLDDPMAQIDGEVLVSVDGERRRRIAALHTMSHVLNALVFDEFDGTLVTGAQINDDGTGRMDFDLSEVDNDRLRALVDPLNMIIANGVNVATDYVSADESASTAGLVRSLSVAPPPTPDGQLRVVIVEGIDRQACGGTHLTNTAQSPPLSIDKIENKGRRNRRIRFSAAGPFPH